MKKIVFCTLVLFVSAAIINCSGGSGGGDGTTPGTGGFDRSILPEIAPEFTYSPTEFPSNMETDLRSLGIFNKSCACDVTHQGWDFMPYWSSYTENKVPIIAVTDGIVEQIAPESMNEYKGQMVSTYTVMLAVAKELEVIYTFEPFIDWGETDSLAWLNVKEGDAVSAGDVIGYLPKVEGNIGEDLIHLDFKVGTGEALHNYVCPTGYFSAEWRSLNLPKILNKIGSCVDPCCE